MGVEDRELLCSPSFRPHPSYSCSHSGSICSVGSPKPASSSCAPLPHPGPISTPVKPGPEAGVSQTLPSRVSGAPGALNLEACLLSHSALAHPAPGPAPRATILHCHFTLLGDFLGSVDFGALSPLIIVAAPQGFVPTSVSCGVVSEPLRISLALGESGSWATLLLPSTYKG